MKPNGVNRIKITLSYSCVSYKKSVYLLISQTKGANNFQVKYHDELQYVFTKQQQQMVTLKNLSQSPYKLRVGMVGSL